MPDYTLKNTQGKTHKKRELKLHNGWASLLLIMITFSLNSCILVMDKSYIPSSFWVINHSTKKVSFQATVQKYSTLSGSYLMTLPFEVNAKDSVLVRQIGYRDADNPADAFTNITFSPVDSILFNDYKNPTSWKMAINKDGRKRYVYHIYDQK